jgi:hypothetical protein
MIKLSYVFVIFLQDMGMDRLLCLLFVCAHYQVY